MGLSAGRRLVQAHDHLRRELNELRELMVRVEAGTAHVGVVRSHLTTMTVRQESWALGAYCQSYCRLLTMHHTTEDGVLFPHLRRSYPALEPTLDRLEEDHRTIHGLVEQLDQALVALITAAGDMAELWAAFDLLASTLLNHLSYEERMLVEPLSRFGLGAAAG